MRALLGEAEQIDPGLALRLREPVRTAAGPRPEQTEDAARKRIVLRDIEHRR